MSKTSIHAKNVDPCLPVFVNLCQKLRSVRVKTSIRVLPCQILSDQDDFYLFEIGRLNCCFLLIRVKNVNLCQKRRSVFASFCWFVSKTSIHACQNVDPCLPCQISSDRDDSYLFKIGRLNCTTFVLRQSVSKRRSVSKTVIRVFVLLLKLISESFGGCLFSRY